ncbi:MAG TPA: hypothetical protein VHF26_15115, partial [Trebonia sp.]|nr:hypothetical protein [Trebonia sp.]
MPPSPGQEDTPGPHFGQLASPAASPSPGQHSATGPASSQTSPGSPAQDDRSGTWNVAPPAP